MGDIVKPHSALVLVILIEIMKVVEVGWDQSEGHRLEWTSALKVHFI